MTGRVAPGWYPDYEAPPGHERFWDGAQWTERRAGTAAENLRPSGSSSSSGSTTSTDSSASVVGWVWAAVAALVVVSAVVLVLGDDDTAQSGPGASPPPASTPGPPASEESEPEPDDVAQRTWEVSDAVDGTTLLLTNGAEVRLVGVVDSCAAPGLIKLVVGQRVTLTRKGPDKDADGRLLRYVDRDGLDVGKRLIQRGWATASDEPNPRRTIYQRVDDRSPDACS